MFAELDKETDIYENRGVKRKQKYAQYDPTNKYFILSQGINENQIGKVGQI